MIELKKRVSFMFDAETVEELKEISEISRIPQARIVEDAVREVLFVERNKMKANNEEFTGNKMFYRVKEAGALIAKRIETAKQTRKEGE